MDLLPTRCVPCEGGVPPLSEEQAQERALLVPDWELREGKLCRSFERKDFRSALAWVNRVGMLAEEEGHHPDFHITSWNRVELVLYTHAIGGLSDNDFVLAVAIDELKQRSGRE
jgi:4a-hydroxytetrahydrobiopterin dehydratase